NLQQASLRKAYLVDANLQGAVLRGTVLQGATLTSADLSQADLEGADLQQARIAGHHQCLFIAALDDCHITDVGSSRMVCRLAPVARSEPYIVALRSRIHSTEFTPQTPTRYRTHQPALVRGPREPPSAKASESP
ncbi:hypothetical protein C2W62_50315, partial [Candidatus Entotheonella serta]